MGEEFHFVTSTGVSGVRNRGCQPPVDKRFTHTSQPQNDVCFLLWVVCRYCRACPDHLFDKLWSHYMCNGILLLNTVQLPFCFLKCSIKFCRHTLLCLYPLEDPWSSLFCIPSVWSRFFESSINNSSHLLFSFGLRLIFNCRILYCSNHTSCCCKPRFWYYFNFLGIFQHHVCIEWPLLQVCHLRFSEMRRRGELLKRHHLLHCRCFHYDKWGGGTN